MSHVSDIVVGGGGGSGLAAALSGAEQGASVTVLEKASKLGGTTALSIGSITASETALQRRAGIVDSRDHHYEDIPKFAPALTHKDNPTLRRILVDHVPETVAWLVSHGLTFFGPMPEPPHRVPRMHNVLPNSRAYIYCLRRALRKYPNVRIVLNATVTGLVFHHERVVGVKAEVGGQPQEFSANKGVILASGDFSNSAEYKRACNPDLAGVEAINPDNTGDGIRIGQEAGGIVLNQDLVFSQLRFVPPPATGLFLKLPPTRPLAALMKLAIEHAPSWLLRPFVLSFVTTFLAPDPSLFREGSILVNKNGERFTDELANPHIALAAEPEKSGYIVFDATVAQKFSAWPHFVSTAPGVAYAYLPDYRRNRRDLYREAADLRALAALLKVSPDKLSATVESHNRTRRESGQSTLSQAPYFALGPVKGWTVLTDGGLAVSARHEVLSSDGAPISGLYAVGSAGQGGLLLEGHGHHLGWSFTSGRRAGAIVAQQPAHALNS